MIEEIFPQESSIINYFHFSHTHVFLFGTGAVMYGIPAAESLITKDKPDLIIAEFFNSPVSMLAESLDIPYATLWSGAAAHPAMYESGLDFDAGVYGLYTPRNTICFFTKLLKN